MSTEIDSKKKHRKVLRTCFTKVANEVDSLLKAKDSLTPDIAISWDLLKTKFEELKICDNEIYEAILENATEEQLVAEMDCSDTYAKRFTELRFKCEKILEPKTVTPDGDDSSSESTRASRGDVPGKRKFKLPHIQFKNYDGSIKDWLSFWAQFRKIDEDLNIDDSDKIEYLLQATVPGSRARQLVESFPIVGENYVKVIDCMKVRFGREDLQIEVYIRELLKLVLTNAMAQQKLDISILYDRIETQLRALESLGITSDKYASILFPLIESCLPQDLLRIWQRSSFSLSSATNLGSTQSLTGEITLENKLKHLMNFLQSETENEQRISLASEGFGLTENLSTKFSINSEYSKKKVSKVYSNSPMAAAGLVNNTETAVRCIFCSGSHGSDACFKAQKMNLDERKNIASIKKACFRCLKIGHQSRKCRLRLKCIICGQPHVLLMCSNLNKEQNSNNSASIEKTENNCVNSIVLANNSNTSIFLQTLRVTLKGLGITRVVRALIDTGSHRSYILKSTASKINLVPIRTEKVVHSLFGGKTTTDNHYCYNVTALSGNDSYTFEVLDQSNICNDISSIFYGPWIKELANLNIHISDTSGQGPIELLLGADVAQMLYTGNIHKLQCGLVAVETCIGWTIMGKVSEPSPKCDSTISVLSLFVNSSISNLWQLDILGIEDPGERKSKEERAFAAKELFLQTVTVNEEGRYEVRLPWLDGHPPLSTNYIVARKRLFSISQKLDKENLFERYNEVFREWESLGIIERVNADVEYGHFLPHHPVLKEGSTTAVRPVFDASARQRDGPSLNQCLEKGLNLIELIPIMYHRFRKNKYGVVSDIKKAFLQISLNEKDRDFLKFLWFDDDRKIIVFRHRRVVFGVNCSPFLLEATIEHHLHNCLKHCNLPGPKYSRETIQLLTKSFYVDNCVTSLPNLDQLHKFINESVIIMADGQFDLRGWEYSSSSDCDHHSVSVLGLKWFPKKDVIVLNPNLLMNSDTEDEVITKRRLLSAAQKVFDPIGFTSPTTLIPKLLLQRLWEKQTSWDAPVNEEITTSFKSWMSDLHYLSRIEIPRWVDIEESNLQDVSIHTFCDASQNAYSAVVFCRVVKSSKVMIHLLASKSRVAPLKKLTIPRLELMGATIAARLYSQVMEGLSHHFCSFFWSDSSTVISWIRRTEEWGTFVSNRVNEIRRLTSLEDWRHVPGSDNPADLPSRGCSPKHLFESRWWEGPAWLYEDMNQWPPVETVLNEEEILKERKKRLVSTLINVNQNDFWHMSYFSKFSKIVNMVAWIFRFVFNAKRRNGKHAGNLSVQEVADAECHIYKLIQAESFTGLDDETIRNFNPFFDSHGIIRLKTKIFNREDTDSFKSPIILPGKNDTVKKLIMQEHQKQCHVGTQGLLCHLRERYWILGGRRIIRSVLSKCVICRRFNSKSPTVESPPLPADRVRDAVTFEICGVDFAGPLYLKSGEKAWVCLFTCAVYRAVHLELTVSLSTSNFLQVFRRFVARRGRPRILYSDNGTNFKGAFNAFKNLNWEQIAHQSSIEQIEWRFNPPGAPWWGGFYERLIGLVKQLLRKILGHACLGYEELYTLICDCESVVNNRPLTYISSDHKDLVTLTPTMFLREQTVNDLSDIDQIEKTSLSRCFRNIQKLRNDMRRRFRIEYLGQLKFTSKKNSDLILKIGDVVLVENNSIKRVEWPLGRIVEVIPGKDGHIRLVRVRSAHGELLRPLQRVYPLECHNEYSEEQKQEIDKPAKVGSETIPKEDNCESAGVVSKSKASVQSAKITRSGRVSIKPVRYS